MSKSYSDRLKDPRWQKRRLKVMEHAGWRCQLCGAKDRTLHCHHSYYAKGKQPWQYPEGAIICLCEPCHDKVHGPKHKEPAIQPPTPPQVEFLEIGVPVAPNPFAAQNRFAEMKRAIQKL